MNFLLEKVDFQPAMLVYWRVDVSKTTLSGFSCLSPQVNDRTTRLTSRPQPSIEKLSKTLSLSLSLCALFKQNILYIYNISKCTCLYLRESKNEDSITSTSSPSFFSVFFSFTGFKLTLRNVWAVLVQWHPKKTGGGEVAPWGRPPWR